LEYEEIIEVIYDAKEIGLKYVKICGAGEPLENPMLVKFAEELTSKGIGLSIFTKGHVLGDDNWTNKIFGNDNIYNSNQLAQKLFELNTSILLSFQSFNYQVQDKIVGNIPGYTDLRNRALEILIKVGFNKSSPTRLALCSNPITKMNYSEIFKIYVFCRERNILPVNAALMVSGKQINAEFLKKNDVSDDEKEEIFIKIYEYNINNGIQTLEEIKKEGISCMPGIHPCNQITNGLYLTCNGNVIRCPGDNNKPLGNTRISSIKEIWENCKNWKYKNVSNVHCPFKDGLTLPENIYKNVIFALEQVTN
jgi:MoaA/NifB/PqqE/SkfB family radical SAM enzyme